MSIVKNITNKVKFHYGVWLANKFDQAPNFIFRNEVVNFLCGKFGGRGAFTVWEDPTCELRFDDNHYVY